MLGRPRFLNLDVESQVQFGGPVVRETPWWILGLLKVPLEPTGPKESPRV